jgi:hypothetical protein
MESVLGQLNYTDAGGVRPDFRTGSQHRCVLMGKLMGGLNIEGGFHLSPRLREDNSKHYLK